MASSDTERPAMDAPGTWSALSHALFRRFWACSFLAFIGAAMQSVGAGWLMTELGGSPLLVGLVQAAYSLSVFLMALPSGVIGDLLDRRVVMLLALTMLMLMAVVTGVCAMLGYLSPTLLLLLTFLFGASAALMTPAMQATTPDIVPRAKLPSALTLHGMAVSAARSVGPGIAGLILAAWGAGWMFIVNASAFIGLFLVILFWRNQQQVRNAVGTRFGSALLDGLRFAKRSAPFRSLLLKTVPLFITISVLLALAPLVVVKNLDGRPQTLGFLLACFGVGSLLSSLTLSWLYQRFSRSRVIDFGSALHAAAVIVIGMSSSIPLSALAMLVAGLCWTALMTSMNIIAQLLLPAAVRARGLSVTLMSTMGSLALGSALWGQAGEYLGVARTLEVAGLAGLALSALLQRMCLDELSPEAPAAAQSLEGSKP